MNLERLTVGQLINELSKFNPDAYIIEDNYDDSIEAHFSWSVGGEYENEGPRNIDKEKREATHMSICFVVNGDPYRGAFDDYEENTDGLEL